MRDVEKRASEAWGPGKSAIAAWDFMQVHVPFDATSSASALTNVTCEVEAFRIGSVQQGPVEESIYNRNGKWRR